MNPGAYRYSVHQPPGPCPEHPDCLIQRCALWSCRHTFHFPLRRRGQPRRFCSTRCRVAEHRSLHG
jgi:hypothetical protein